jgi:MFS family permease
MVNDMAPDHLRGRYNAISSAGFQAASVAGPPVAGLLIGHHLDALWIALLLVGLLLVAAVSVLAVEPRLTEAANGLRPPNPVDLPSDSPSAAPAVPLVPEAREA